MRRRLDQTENLSIIEGEVAEIQFANSRVAGVELANGTKIEGRTCVLTTGTFLNGLIHVGRKTFQAGRSGDEGRRGGAYGVDVRLARAKERGRRSGSRVAFESAICES